MKLLKHFASLDEAQVVSGLLRSKGILTSIAGKDSYYVGKFSFGVTEVSLWIVLDHQYEDAMLLLSNLDHDPVSKLTEVDMNELEHMSNQSSSVFLRGSFNVVASTILGIILVVLVGYVLYGLFSSGAGL